MNELIDKLNQILSDDLPVSFTDGGVVRDGYDAKLDEFRNYERNATKLLLELEAKEKKNSGIENLKISFNNVFGYYFQVSKSHLDKVPEYFVRKQTLTNYERFYTQELKEIEDNILSSKDNALKRENEILEDLFKEIENNIPELQSINKEIAYIDFTCSFAEVAVLGSWVLPKFHKEDEIKIKSGRHPLVEQSLGVGEYISNDLDFSLGVKFALITGPNMGGKSTYLRQNAILVYLAHLGSYVPASEMNLPLIDGIFTRIGASDALQEGKSTFMVEMQELSDICRDATNKSFIIIDEIGRGTSTNDGLAIARSVLRFFVEQTQGFNLFATHFFDLIKDVDNYKTAENYHLEVYEDGDDVAFLHSVKKGSMAKSFGIHVAEKSGLPEDIIQNAKDLVKTFNDAKPIDFDDKKRIQPSLFSTNQIDKRDQDLEKFLEYDLNSKSPIEALYELNQLQKKIKAK